MTRPPAELVEVFRAQIAAVVSAARAYLDEVPERGALPIREVFGAGENTPARDIAEDPNRQEIEAMRRYRLGMPALQYAGWWGAGHRELPPAPADAPETYADAVALAERETGAYAADKAAALVDVVEDLVISDLVPEVLASAADLARDWPLFVEGGTARADAFAHTAALLGWDADRGNITSGRMAVDVGPRGRQQIPDGDAFRRAVAQWARRPLNDAYARSFPDSPRNLPADQRPPGSVPPPGDQLVNAIEQPRRLGAVFTPLPRVLALVYLAERAALWRTRATFAAGEAWRRARELVATIDPSAVFQAAVRTALDVDATADPPDRLAVRAAGNAEAERRAVWSAVLVAEARRLVAEVLAGDAPGDEAAARASGPTKAGPVLRWDAALARSLEAFGENGRTLAEEVRTKAAGRFEAAAGGGAGGELWVLWTAAPDTASDVPPRWLSLLALVLWRDQWRPTLERPLAMSRGGLVTILQSLSAQGVDNKGAIMGADGSSIGTLHSARAVEAAALQGMGASSLRKSLDTLLAVRFVPWFAGLVQRRESEIEWLHFEAIEGWNVYGAIVESLGLPVNEERAAAMKRAMEGLAGQIITLEGGIDVSIFDGYRYQRGGGHTKGGAGNRSRLALRPGPPWWSRTTDSWVGEYVHLAPLPDLEGGLPPLYGRPNEHAALARFYLLFLAELAKQSINIAREGVARIPAGRLPEIAMEARVKAPPPILIGKQLDLWREAEIIERVGSDGYNLHPRFEAERAMLVTGGNQRIGAAEGGRRSAAERAAARGRLAEVANHGKRGPKAGR